ncbi:DUF2750 domain-containing protein [Priestia flexa]|uniref:DUF2750 domain-containing protein n=1 Tax=Priestia flexa TaxID=86664 RepID=UPI001B329A71|nr:DUF2750 domain-containing protein [Priestia flexa]
MMVEQSIFQQLVNASAHDRYTYFIEQVIKCKRVWIVLDEYNQVKMTGNDDNKRLVPVWPCKEYAQCCLQHAPSGCRVIAISLDTFMNELLLGMKKKGMLSSVFWNGLDTIIIGVDQLLFDLEWEIGKTEIIH